MRWNAEERLRRALPYGMWRWRRQDGAVVETIFANRYVPLATRIDGIASREVVTPPERMDPVEYFYGAGINSPRNGFPWRSAAVRRHCETIARGWGLDPDELYWQARAALHAERLEWRRGRR
jgi:hypothetical protein